MKHAPSWEYMQSFETQWLSRRDIVNLTYEAAAALNDMKCQYGLLSKNVCSYIRKRIEREKVLMEIINKRVDEHNGDFSRINLDDLDIDWKEMLTMKSTCASDELERPLWITESLHFPRFMRNLIYTFWFKASTSRLLQKRLTAK